MNKNLNRAHTFSSDTGICNGDSGGPMVFFNTTTKRVRTYRDSALTDNQSIVNNICKTVSCEIQKVFVHPVHDRSVAKFLLKQILRQLSWINKKDAARLPHESV